MASRGIVLGSSTGSLSTCGHHNALNGNGCKIVMVIARFWRTA